MSSDTKTSPIVPAVSEGSKTDWPSAQARVSDDDLLEIDKARAHGGYSNRTEFLLAVIFNAVRTELRYERVADAEKALLPKAS